MRRRFGSAPFTRELLDAKLEIEGYAREYGLDFFDTIFEILDYYEINMVAAYGGFPTRYSHWRWGMEYEEMQKGYAYGLHKIYEMVINNDPCYAYLLESNAPIDQKIVMAHVYAHNDFFKNSAWFVHTNRKMMDEMANHGMRIRRYMDKFGVDRVERFIDRCLSLDNLIDVHSPYIRREPKEKMEDKEGGRTDGEVKKLRSKEYMDKFINPPEFLEQQRERLQNEIDKSRKFPLQPEKDVLKFLMEHSPLTRWQRDILDIIREEAYYFAPQAMTKIMNEGWATYWHSTIMTTRVLTDAELIDYADHHAGTLGSRPGQLNPYKVGVELYRDIEDRWNRGKFGTEYEQCDDMAKKKRWNLNLGLGRERIFQVRAIYNDITFIDEFLTKEFCEDQKLFVYAYNRETGQPVIVDREFEKIKQQFLSALANFGQPQIRVEEGNFQNRGELYLMHAHEGMDLKLSWARDTLENLCAIWGRPVHIETKIENRRKVLSFDGEKHSDKAVK
ncbi:MAG: SpoVR family protein [Planctomycetota bacterium]|nr:MAG: SpoVR family protein [Planctomycetota bacterium]